jgi:NAD(P)-dependent dehydrogenase (short-subunit alcohol dehydrogenase family)
VVALDVTDHDSIRAAVAHAETEVGSIDILVNNSGVSTTQRLQDVQEETTTSSSTPTSRAFFVAQEVGKRMLARARAPRRAPSPAGASSTSPPWPGSRCCRRSACTA